MLQGPRLSWSRTPPSTTFRPVLGMSQTLQCACQVCVYYWSFALHMLLKQTLQLLTADMHARSHRGDSLHGALSMIFPCAGMTLLAAMHF